MPEFNPIRRALISVYDKTGIVEFAHTLHDEFGVEILSTGGTAKALCEAGIPVIPVESITGFGEMLDGRVKTLHPNIHAAILADRDNPGHMRQLADAGVEPIDLVVVNLYPFEKTVADPNCKFEQAIEMIDIGGVALLRAAAKNHKHVLVISDISDGWFFIQQLRKPTAADADAIRDWRRERGFYALRETARYDAEISRWLGRNMGYYSLRAETLWVSSDLPRLRYGENPHQSADLLQCEDPRPLDQIRKRKSFALAELSSNCVPDGSGSLRDRDALPLSYNNFLDADAARNLCAELTRASRALQGQPAADAPREVLGRRSVGPAQQSISESQSDPFAENQPTCVPACCFIKHTNPCGVGIASEPVEAYRRAYLGDPNAAMGGILAVNFDVETPFAQDVMDSLAAWGKAAGAGAFFIEVWLAPRFSDDAVSLIRTRKKWGETVRLLAVGDMAEEPRPNELHYRSIAGGMLVQSPDLLGLNEADWQVVTKRSPDQREIADLRLAWLICKHAKSNAITICRDGMLLGAGAGQMSRVMSCRIAAWLARENGHADRLAGSVAASDAFFPFRDGPSILMDAGVTAFIQPGGSKRDAETIAACDERGVAMIFTKTRHFRH